MRIKKKILKEVIYPYAVNAYDIGNRKKLMFATELDGPCVGIWADTLEEEQIWDGFGGTMNTCQLNEKGDFLAIQNFYKGFNSHTAKVVKVTNINGNWDIEEVLRLPFCHRMCVVNIEDQQYVICCVVANNKKDKADWSEPGRVEIGQLGSDGKLHMTLLLDGIHKNHGMYKGTLNGQLVVIITGVEGAYKIAIPEKPGNPWEIELLIEREISDATVVDIDGDGQDEIITIEKFHGNQVVINKLIGGKWNKVYSYPVEFGHAIWSGQFLSKPAFLIGYRAANAALLMFTLKEKREDEWFMDVTVIDEHEAPTNITVVHADTCEQLFCCSGGKNRIVLYEISE